MFAAQTKPFGIVKVSKVEKVPDRVLSWKELLYWTFPHAGLDADTRAWRLKNWPRMLRQIMQLVIYRRVAKWAGHPVMYGKLWLTHLHGKSGREQLLGLVSLKEVTDVFVADVVDEMDEATDDASLKTYNYHGIGTGTTIADQTDTDLETELTTEYTGDVRGTGAQSQPSANIYQTLATNTLDSGTPAVTEQGVFTSSTVGSGTLCDRHTFAAKNLDGGAGDGLQSQYQLTCSAGG